MGPGRVNAHGAPAGAHNPHANTQFTRRERDFHERRGTITLRVVMRRGSPDVTDDLVAGDELKALRHVATLVAEGVPPEDLFAVVAEEIARVVGVPMVSVARFDRDGSAVGCARYSSIDSIFRVGDRWILEGPSVVRLVRDTGKAARIDDYSSLEGPIAEEHRRSGIRSTVGSPIVVGGRLWGAVIVSTTESEPLPDGTEARLADFTELIATAIANAETREALARLVDEQAAMGRLATLAMREIAIAEIFSAMSDELDELFDAGAAVLRFEDDPPACEFVGISHRVDIPIGTRWEFEDGMASAEVHRTGGAARVDAKDWWSARGPVASTAQRLGVVSTVASPIVVEGRRWGALTITSTERLLPVDTEARLEQFSAFVATAISSADSRDALAQLAGEQAALRRVATLVAQEVGPVDICSSVSKEVAGLFAVEQAAVWRFDPDGQSTRVGIAKEFDGATIGSRSALSNATVVATVRETGRSARVDNPDWSVVEAVRAFAPHRDIKSRVASPIIVEGRVWGAIGVTSPDVLPRGSEQRLEKFTELVATAIANGEARTALAHLGDEQAALLRVATLVAQGAPPTEIFTAVSVELDRLFGLDRANVGRFDPSGPAFVVVGAAEHDERIPLGSRWEINDLYAASRVFRTGRSARVDEHDLAAAGGPVAEWLISQGILVQLCSPITVEGHFWGVLSLTAREPLPDDAEERLEKFSALIATAIANAENKAELGASRRRLVTASDDARRRIERDLHDGTQQRLVALGLALRAATADVPEDRPAVRSELSRVAAGLADAVVELQELSRGIHPAILSKGGLGPALRTLARRSPIPVELDISMDERLPEPIEVGAYYAASEALANAAKHSRASFVELSLTHEDGRVVLRIRDDGVGGADPAGGSGLMGLTDRVEALDGTMRVSSAPGDGTTITVELPLASTPSPG
jgi:signal transduction histidine kinase